MKETIKRTCGHEEVIEVFGKNSQREWKISNEESKMCDECYARKMNANCEEVEMLYRDYKNEYEDCKTLPNSYNASTKTIVVFVPKKEEETEVQEVIENATDEEIVKKLTEAGFDEKQAEIMLAEGSKKGYDKLEAWLNSWGKTDIPPDQLKQVEFVSAGLNILAKYNR